RRLSINWDAAKRVWKTSFINDSKLFNELVSACPHPLSCLESVDRYNLMNLIKNMNSPSLAYQVLQCMKPGPLEHKSPDSAYYMASWIILLHEIDKLIEKKPLNHLKYTLNTLLWASQYAIHYLNISVQDKDEYFN